MKSKFITFVGALALSATAAAQTWIWYPGDYEIWLGNQMNNRRTERGAFFPPFWKTDSHYVVVEFSKQLNLSAPEEIFIAAEGKYNVKLDGKLQFGMPSTLKLPAGKHNLNIKVWNQSTPPAIYVKGATVNSGSDWKVTYEDKEWIDESGKASDTSATVYMDAGCWNFDGATQLPSRFSLMRQPVNAASATPQKEGVLYDFGKETFGYVTWKDVKGKVLCTSTTAKVRKRRWTPPIVKPWTNCWWSPVKLPILPFATRGVYIMNIRYRTVKPFGMSTWLAIRVSVWAKSPCSTSICPKNTAAPLSATTRN